MSKGLMRIAVAVAIALGANAGNASAQNYHYGDDCRDQNRAVGTVPGALAGGIVGSQFGHGGGRVAATVGGVFLGGVAGNAIAGDMDCADRRYAFKVYQQGFYGPIGQRYEWRNEAEGDYGYFTPTKEYYDGPYQCRDFTIQTWRRGARHDHNGAACREDDGNWHFR